MCSCWCRGRRVVGREHSPEERQCWWCGGLDVYFPCLTSCCLSVRKFMVEVEVLMVFFQTCSRTPSDHLPVVDSPQCWGMVSCNCWCLSDLSTLKPCHWKRIGSLAYQNNSSLPLSSPFPVSIWPVYTRLCSHSCKHLFLAWWSWVLQWTMVCCCCKLKSPGRNAHIFTQTDIGCYSLCELVQIVCSSVKNDLISEVETGFSI